MKHLNYCSQALERARKQKDGVEQKEKTLSDLTLQFIPSPLTISQPNPSLLNFSFSFFLLDILLPFYAFRGKREKE